MDTRASHHTVSNTNSLQSFIEYPSLDEILLGDGNTLNISHVGKIYIPIKADTLSLSDVLCVPQL